MKRNEAKAEAEKIKEMLTEPFLQTDFEGVKYSTVGDLEITELSIIHVKGIIETHIHDSPIGLGSYHSEATVDFWQSILTELERK